MCTKQNMNLNTMKLSCELLLLILINGLLASPTPQNIKFPNQRNTHQPKNDTLARSRKIDVNTNCDDKFCLDDPNYPKNYIQSLNLESYKHLFGNDLFDQFSLRIGPDEQGLCQSRKRLIHPKRGKTASGNWLTIVNDEKYQQGILVEECVGLPSRCDYTQNFPLSVIAECRQSYHYRKVLAITFDGRPIQEHFEFPSCCKCFISVGKQTSAGTSSRIGTEFPETKTNIDEDSYVLPY